MKNRHPVFALVLLTVAVFLALGDQGGALGQNLASFANRAVGQPGTVLVVLVLIASAYLIGAPTGTTAKIARSIRAHRPVQRPARVDALIEVVASPALSPDDRRKADSVRTAMKSLGYLKHEYDPVVAGLDLNMSLEGLVRLTLQKLHQQKRVS